MVPQPSLPTVVNVGFLRRRLVLVIVVAVFGIGGAIFRDRLSGSAGDLRTGDCFDLPTGLATIKDVQHHPCADPHDAEVMVVVVYPVTSGAGYPSENEFDRFAETQCVATFASYTGTSYEANTALGAGYLLPTPEGWTRGDHDVTCYLTSVSGAKLMGSRRAGVI